MLNFIKKFFEGTEETVAFKSTESFKNLLAVEKYVAFKFANDLSQEQRDVVASTASRKVMDSNISDWFEVMDVCNNIAKEVA